VPGAGLAALGTHVIKITSMQQNGNVMPFHIYLCISFSTEENEKKKKRKNRKTRRQHSYVDQQTDPTRTAF